MLQLAQRTSAPSSVNVSIKTAVWIVMCSEPEMRAPASGLDGPYSLRMAIRPGISCSARIISLRPNGASERSATRKSKRPFGRDANVDDIEGPPGDGKCVERRTVVKRAEACWPPSDQPAVRDQATTATCKRPMAEFGSAERR